MRPTLQANPEVSELHLRVQDAGATSASSSCSPASPSCWTRPIDALPGVLPRSLVNPERYQVDHRRVQRPAERRRLGARPVRLPRPAVLLLNGLRNATIAMAVIQAIAAFLLISNMVQVAAFTRREETEIMRLVGATRWYTQLPFIAGGRGRRPARRGARRRRPDRGQVLFVDKALGRPDQGRHHPRHRPGCLIYIAPILARRRCRPGRDLRLRHAAAVRPDCSLGSAQLSCRGQLAGIGT